MYCKRFPCLKMTFQNNNKRKRGRERENSTPKSLKIQLKNAGEK